MTVLIFPSSLEASARMAADARARGERVIGASSVEADPYRDRYDAWAPLPFIGEAAFPAALAALAEAHGVETVITPHSATYSFLEQLLADDALGPRLGGRAPHLTQMDRVREAVAGADAAAPTLARLASAGPAPDQLFLASLLTQADAIYGECSREKILGLCAAAADAPPGDVVEIGAFFGKSAYVLNRLAANFGLGATLAVDSWRLEDTVQYGSPRHIQDLSRVWDWDLVFDGFRLNMLATTSPPFNYLRAASAAAWAVYATGAPVVSPEFGSTAIAGRVSLLHIDANHDEAAVAADFEAWSTALAPGGWLVFDDYCWPHGDGPRRVADRAAAGYGDRVIRSFIAGGALFLKIN